MSIARKLKIYLNTTDRIITQTLHEFLTSLEYEVLALNSIHALPHIIAKESELNGLVIIEENIFKGVEKKNIWKIHKQFPGVLFVVITENPPVFTAKEAIAYGIYGYLHRPISLAELELLLVRLNETRIG